MAGKRTDAKSAEEVRFANTTGEKNNARSAEEIRFASIQRKGAHVLIAMVPEYANLDLHHITQDVELWETEN